jgi:hypothetical protein
MKHLVIAMTALLLVTGSANASDEDDKRPRAEHRGPPPVALEACASSVQGDPCSFEGRRGELLEGTCEAPTDKPLACRPADTHHPQQHDE